jgi:parvulin-like peptidyl-prolyl isomerase
MIVWWTLAVSAEVIDQIVVVVNRTAITLYQVQNAEKQLTVQQAFSSDDTPETKRSKTIDYLIENELIQQTAEESGVLVTDEELNAALNDIKKRNNISSDERLKDIIFQQEGKTWEEFLDDIRKQIKVAKLINREVRSQVEITEEEVEQFYQDNMERFKESPQSVHLRHILLQVAEQASDSEVDAVREKANQLIQELRNGAGFAALARQYSDHASSENGGELGTFKKGELAAPFDIAFTMETGEVSEPVRSDQGFHIIFVEEKTGGAQASFENAKPTIRQRLFEQKTNELYKKWVAELKDQAYIEVK